MEGAGGSAAGRRISAAAGFRTGAAAGLHMGAVLLASIAENPYKYYITSNKLQLAQALVSWMTVAEDTKPWPNSN